MPQKVAKTETPEAEVTKEQGRLLIRAGEKLWKRVKHPEDYDADPADIAEVNRLIDQIDAAVRKIKAKKK